jgi:DNA-binding XRE family transcriptional regulator
MGRWGDGAMGRWGDGEESPLSVTYAFPVSNIISVSCLKFQALRVLLALMSEFPSEFVTLREREQQIGAAIRQLRLEAQLDQAGLAHRANVSRSAVQALELGKGTRLHTLLAVLRALNRLDVFDGIVPWDGPTPLQVLAESRRAATKRQRYRKPRS